MAPPAASNPLTRNFAKKLKVRSEFMPEEDRISFLWQHIPNLWQEELLDELVESEINLSSQAIFDFLERKFDDTLKLEPVSIKINKLFEIKFPFKIMKMLKS